MRISRRLSSLIHFHNIPKWPGEVLKAVEASCSVRPNFISEEEEKCILTEVEPHMKRLRYEKSHWDDAIHLYREREQRKWSETSEKILQRVRETSFPKEAHHLTHVHILDLHKDGVIKPHIDSIRYCGDIITGISLLSDCVMRLRHKDQKDLLMVDLMLPRRSLYILGGPGRYDFTHEVLSEEESVFEERKVARGRRISIICRDLPKKENIQQQGEEIRLQPIPVNEMAFPLHCETYQIGKRTYRRNPYKHSASRKIYSDVGDTPDLYPEDDEGDDGPSCAVNSYGEKNCDVAASEEPRIVIERQPAKIETPEGEIISVEDSRISIIQGKWTAEIDVPPFAHSKLIGIRGKNLRELQDNTGCRVDIPRRGVKGPVVVRSKDGIESVQRCLELIQAVVDQGKAHARFTHFTAFACNQPAVLERYKVFREAVMTSATISETAKDEDLFIKPDRLHLTISMLWILELVDEMKAKLTLDAASEEISKLLNGKPVKVSIKGLSIMNDDPAHVDVLYAVISGEHIQNISNIVYKHMVEAGLSPVAEADVSTTAEPVKLHLTLMNSRKQAEKTGKKRRSFDATELLKEFKDYDFGTITIDKISICSLKSVDVGGYYTELSSISL